ncbi:MAG: HAMP domain-containing histidine kinase [Cellvibrionales bacterium]|jgi:two-component system sensor histidine kinase RegB|nr:HAMP domain-containing histidine kinase [Cellvibrionales bacterium]TXH48612.1 MAG: HAMP domain-containing histidine kinase [Cellvibrionales bacterium]
MSASAHSPAPDTSDYLQQLQVLRAWVWLVQLLTLLLGRQWLSAAQFYALLGLLSVALLMLLLGHYRLQWFRRQSRAPDEREFLFQLLLDCFVLTGLLYVAGGATNPFVSYYLVPIALAAACLSRTYTALLTAFCLLASGLLMFYYWPLPVLSPMDMSHHAMHGSRSMSWHVAGMWLNVGISAALITYFVTSIAATVRRQREAINRLREQQLMDENILTVATLAASTAHEMGTPLSSLAVLLGDLQREHNKGAELQADLQLMASQVARCQQSLRQLADTARAHQQGGERSQPLAEWVQRLIGHWQVLRPEAQAKFVVQAGAPCTVAWPLVVEQAVINVLNNAADAGSHLWVRMQWDVQTLQINIEDDGPGIEQHVLRKHAQVKTSEKGMGLGLLLSHASLERAGGRLSLEPRAGGGTLTRIELPLHGAELA